MEDTLPFGLQKKTTYASLSSLDLESLGKQAASAYLCDGVSLNNAVIKYARQHPSISPHQVQRIVEFANQETFSKLFEKQAGDKNIEFPVADPRAILLELNDGARPHIMTPTPDEYSSDPVKMAYSGVEADIELARVFGFDMASPHSEKTVISGFEKVADVSHETSHLFDRIMGKTATSGPADRIMEAGEEDTKKDSGDLSEAPAPMDAKETTYDEDAQKEGMAPMMGGPPAGPPAGAMGVGAGGGMGVDEAHHEKMLSLTRSVELEKKKQELAAIQQKTLQGMAGPQGPQEAQAPQAAPAGPAGMAPSPAPAQGPPAPPMGGLAGGGAPEKMASDLTKQAMAYVKTGRPHTGAALRDLSQATSLGRIKRAAAERQQYPMANPHGEFLRTKQKIAKLLEDATYAKDKNEALHKEATACFQKAVTQHMLNGGNIGEVAHVMSHVHRDGVKTALASVMPELVKHGFDPVKAQVASIQYEMEKGASRRMINPKHPIAEAYADVQKLAEGGTVLNKAWSQLKASHMELGQTLQEVMAHAAAS